MNSPRIAQPQPTCRNCWITYLAAKPHGAIFYCHHYQTLAHRIAGDEWEVTECVHPDDVKALRHSLARRQR